MPCYEQTNKKKGLKSETTFFCIFSHNKEALKIRDKMIKSLLHMPTRYQVLVEHEIEKKNSEIKRSYIGKIIIV